MSNVNTVVFTIVLVLFVIVTVVGFLSARWRRPVGTRSRCPSMGTQPSRISWCREIPA